MTKWYPFGTEMCTARTTRRCVTRETLVTLVTLASEHRRERMTLSVGHRPDGLLLGHGESGKQPVAAGLTPAVLADQEVSHRHAARLPRAVDDHLGHVDLAGGHPTLELGAGEADLVGA